VTTTRGVDFSWADFLVTTAVSAAVVVLLMALVATLVRVRGRIAVVDVVWGLGFITVALTSLLLGTLLQDDQDPHDHDLRLWLLLAMVLVWGGRLAWHIARRSKGAGEDPRYEELMARGTGGLFRKVLLPQGLAIWFVSLPLQVSAGSYGTIGFLTWIGVALWVLGMVFESVGDAQLTAYRAQQRESRPPVMDRGLWRFTRHPNYFGDACVWWGIWLVAADSWPGVLTVLSPVAMTYFLVFATGARLLERTMMQRPGYPEYAARTSMFFPLPPKQRSSVS
jgi:steroid 5-alpha reductase family enzyme